VDWNVTRDYLGQMVPWVRKDSRSTPEIYLVLTEGPVNEAWELLSNGGKKREGGERMKVTRTVGVGVEKLITVGEIRLNRAICCSALGMSSRASSEMRDAISVDRTLESGVTMSDFVFRLCYLNRIAGAVWTLLADRGMDVGELQTLGEAILRISPEDQFCRVMEKKRNEANNAFESLLAEPIWRRSLKKDAVGSIGLPERFIDGRIRMSQLEMNRAFDQSIGRAERRQLWLEPDPFAQGARVSDSGVLIPELRGVLHTSALLREAAIAIAVERYSATHNQELPRTLEQLVPEFLSAVPLDPYDGQPMRFKTESDGRYRIWAIGDDRRDDGGCYSYPGDIDRDISWPSFKCYVPN
jgi:hypothetical protein